GTLADGTEVKLYRLQSPGGLILDVSDYGGRLVRCYAPEKFGNLADVTLGWNTPGEYEKLGFSMGTLIGRYGNRIADGKFTLDGKEYQ
ncbi:MAG: galactose-1-epimerase, partial [Kiritimatiellae bacterium]|nr:galactose-1-epimerase [Kiritimatiellia bacterium]